MAVSPARQQKVCTRLLQGHHKSHGFGEYSQGESHIQWQPRKKKNCQQFWEIKQDILFCVYICVIQQNISKHKYQNRVTFLSDVSLIYNNSIKYNGKYV